MKRHLISLFILFISSTIITSVSAQDATYKCDLTTMQGVLDGLIGQLTEVKSSKETDPVKIADIIERATITANIMRASCDNLVFKDHIQKVIGPVEIPKGVYKVKLETKSEGYIGIEASPASGECGGGVRGSDTLLFNTGGSSFSGEGEIVFTSGGCDLIIQVNISDAPWTLSFERLSTS